MIPRKKSLLLFVLLAVGVAAGAALAIYYSRDDGLAEARQKTLRNDSGQRRTFLIAGGCFWCVEHDLKKVPGVLDVVSGYAGGNSEEPTYENYSSAGHREVVKVTFDPQQVSEFGLVVYALKHMDPTDGDGSFNDRGKEYAPAVYYENEAEKKVVEAALDYIGDQNVFDKELAVDILPRPEFWPAEEYHQDYAEKNPLRYSYYRSASGRDDFVEEHWGSRAGEIPEPPADLPSLEVNDSVASEYAEYNKPSEDKLREMLSDIQFEVTQEDGTEIAFNNPYWDNTKPGIYVDILSGEPLFSSKDKFKSGTGWPSFTQPLEPDLIVLKDDWGFLVKRVEVRSRYGDNHLGHVFDDGPTTLATSGGAEPTGQRWCMNSAALRFIPLENLNEEGYGQYAAKFEE